MPILRSGRGIPFPILIPLPIRQNIANARTIRQPINLLKVLLRDFKRLGRDIRDILPYQFARVDCRPIDLLEEERAEGFHAGAQEGAVEGHIDAFEGDGGKSAFEFDGLGFGGCLFGGFADDFYKVGFHVFHR